TTSLHGIASSVPSSSVSRSCPFAPVNPRTSRYVWLPPFSKLRFVTRSGVPSVNVPSAATNAPCALSTWPVNVVTCSITPPPPAPSPMITRVTPSSDVPGAPPTSKYSSVSPLGWSARISLRNTGPVSPPPPSSPQPNVDGSGPYHAPPAASRWSECPTGVDAVSATPMSTDVMPAAGPSVAVNVPSYERNSTTAPVGSTSASPSGAPFWIPACGKRSPPFAWHVSGITPERAIVAYGAPLLPLYSTTLHPARSVPAGPETSTASSTSVPSLS